ncbi:MAG: low molecular weight phosphotyrosine protein phosphatase [Verrucomicrobiales bacterium]|nr:low molecular weight phosphotyrosine protein phosphatase [Verrucomicrobiales bacterium]
MKAKFKILFVCWGNICRSPTAENVMRAVIEREGLQQEIEVDSAGTLHIHAGNRPDSRMTEAVERRGYQMKGRARGIELEDFELFDLILVMDLDNQSEVLALRESYQGEKGEVKLFCDFCDQHKDQVVPDPYYGGPEGFEKVLDLIEGGCEGIVKWYRGGVR